MVLGMSRTRPYKPLYLKLPTIVERASLEVSDGPFPSPTISFEEPKTPTSAKAETRSQQHQQQQYLSSQPSCLYLIAHTYSMYAIPRRLRLGLALVVSLATFVYATSRAEMFGSDTSVQQEVEIYLKPQIYPIGSQDEDATFLHWSEEPLLPPPNLLDSIFEGKNVVLPHKSKRTHTITAYPRQIQTDKLPHPVGLHHVIFGFVSTAKRLKTYAPLWKYFIGEQQHCLVALDEGEEDQVERLQSYLQLELGYSGCQVVTRQGRSSVVESLAEKMLRLPKLIEDAEWLDLYGGPTEPKYLVLLPDDAQMLNEDALRRTMSTRDHHEDHLLCASTPSVILDNPRKACDSRYGYVLSQSMASRLAVQSDDCLRTIKPPKDLWPRCASLALGGISVDDSFETAIGIHPLDIYSPASIDELPRLPIMSFARNNKDTPERIQDLTLKIEQLLTASFLLGVDNLFQRYIFDGGKAMIILGHSITISTHALGDGEHIKKLTNDGTTGRTLFSQEHVALNQTAALVESNSTIDRYYMTDIDAEKSKMIYTHARGPRIVVNWIDPA